MYFTGEYHIKRLDRLLCAWMILCLHDARYPGEDILRIIGFNDEVISTGFKTLDHIHRAVQMRHQDDTDVVKLFMLCYRSTQGYPSISGVIHPY